MERCKKYIYFFKIYISYTNFNINVFTAVIQKVLIKYIYAKLLLNKLHKDMAHCILFPQFYDSTFPLCQFQRFTSFSY